ncbi:MAG: signal peptidase II [Patescibacteria group bacterium]
MLTLLAVIALTVIDRVIKTFAFDAATPQPIIGAALSFHPAVNPLGPFGIPMTNSWVLALGGIAIGMFSIVVLHGTARPYRFGAVLVLIGGASNLLDRFRYGYVIDTFRFSPGLIFNTADLYIVFGVFIIVGMYIREWRNEHLYGSTSVLSSDRRS